MVPVKLLPYCFGLSVLFLVFHGVVLMLKLSDVMIFGGILLSMGITQYLAYTRLKKGGYEITFKSIFSILCVTQVFSVILLTIYSAYNPFEIAKPMNFTEVISSLLLFGILLPLVLTAIIWFATKKKPLQA